MTVDANASMKRLAQTVRKLRGRSLDELRVRGRQALAAYLERVGVVDPATTLRDAVAPGHDADSLFARFREPSRARPLAGLTDPARTAAAVRLHCPGAEAAVVERAEQAVAGRFDLLGYRGLWFGDPIDWSLDPVAGRRAPAVHWSRVPFLDHAAVGDHKVVWELNRHQHFVTLGQAYWYTGDERYAEAFAAQATHWLRANPPKVGMNWASSLEVAFRAISWVWALQLFRASPALSSELFGEMVTSLSVHARHLEANLSTYFSPNTHLTGEALGLFYVGRSFPELSRASEWLRLGEAILLRQLPRQVRDDGVYFEQASYYHRYTVDFYLHLWLLDNGSGRVRPALVRPLPMLLDHLLMIARPDGTSPLFGDDDGGRLLFLDPRRSDDYRPSLSTGAVVFESPEYAFGAGELSAETIWLTGPEGGTTWATLTPRPPARTSAAFESSGFYVMRDNWSSTANTLLADGGPHGILNCGHAHADALAIDVTARGHNIVTDPGTYTYTASAEDRNWFRSSLAHSAVWVDGESSSVPATPFAWSTQARARTLRWYADARFDFFEGSHDGYERLADPVGYRRAILFAKGDYWVIRDSLVARQRHDIGVAFQAAPGVTAEPLGTNGVRLRAPGGAALDVVAIAPSGQFLIEDGWVSRAYGSRAACPKCTYELTAHGSADITSILIPHDSAGDGWHVVDHLTHADGATAVTLRRGPAIDVAAFNVCGEIGGTDVMATADWCWTRRVTDAPLATHCAAIGVRELRVGGVSVVSTERPAAWVVVERNGDLTTVRRHEPAHGAR